MKNENILLVLGAGLVAYFFFGRRQQETATLYTLPDGRRVPVEQLPSLGYFYNDGSRGGQPGWYHQSQLPQNLQPPASVQPGTRQWYDYIAPALSTAAGIWTAVSPFFRPRPTQPQYTPGQNGAPPVPVVPGSENWEDYIYTPPPPR